MHRSLQNSSFLLRVPASLSITQVDDNAIHAAVKAKLTADRFSNLLNVDVNVTNGVVTLAGEVPNAQVKAEAEREARSVSGVVGVKNNLQVKAPSR
jgi:osmotically-inducible protein OsmY